MTEVDKILDSVIDDVSCMRISDENIIKQAKAELRKVIEEQKINDKYGITSKLWDAAIDSIVKLFE